MSDAVLADEYWREFALARSNRAERLAAGQSMAATDAVNDRVEAGAAGIVDYLVFLANCAPDPQADSLSYLGAGPVEDLVNQHAEQLIEEIEAAARRNDRFRYSLSCAWFENSIDPALPQRLRRFGDCPQHHRGGTQRLAGTGVMQRGYSPGTRGAEESRLLVSTVALRRCGPSFAAFHIHVARCWVSGSPSSMSKRSCRRASRRVPFLTSGG